ncbi:unnamed protein product, partial [Allacma fusca]
MIPEWEATSSYFEGNPPERNMVEPPP